MLVGLLCRGFYYCIKENAVPCQVGKSGSCHEVYRGVVPPPLFVNKMTFNCERFALLTGISPVFTTSGLALN
jgi:hypothetical protein